MGQRKLRAAALLKFSVVAVTISVFGYGAWSGSTSVSDAVVTSTTVAPMKVTTTTPALTVVVATTAPPVTTTTTSTTIVVPTTQQFVLASIESPVISEVESLICDAKWEWDCGEAKAVAQCESQMRPDVVSPPNTNGTRDRGLFQINSVWREAFGERLWARIFEPATNVAMAHHIWKTGNRSWMYWTCQP